jgi:hypothetical protein
MLTRTLTRLGSLVLLAAALGSCGGDAAAPLDPEGAARALAAGQPLASNRAPSAAPSLEVVEPPVLATSMRRTRQLRRNISTFALIGARGGRLEIKSAGLTVIVPPGAVTRPTLFRVTALKGDMVAYDFGPHGTHFAVPLRVEQAVRQTDWWKARQPQCEAGYFKDIRQLDGRRRRALVDEFLPVAYDARAAKMSFEVEHFSGYMISTGHTKGDDPTITP